MELNENDLIQLEALWRGELDQKDQDELEKRLSTDIAFYEAALEWKTVVYKGFAANEIELAEQYELKQQLAALENSLAPLDLSETRIRTLNAKYWRIAAVIAFLVIVGATLHFLNQRPLYESYYSHLERDNMTLSDGRSEGEIAYDAYEYARAWQLLEKEIQTPNDSLNLLYAGVAALNSGANKQAIGLLAALLENTEWSDYHLQAKWYLSLAYLADGQREKAKKLLTDIMGQGDIYVKEANEILEQLRDE